MRQKSKLKIGEFSKMMQVTVKTLRHYEQRGLLLPNEVDEWTGYRYYSIAQMQRLNTIRGLQRQGFTLEEVKELLEDGGQMPSIELLAQKNRGNRATTAITNGASQSAAQMDGLSQTNYSNGEI